MSENRVGVNGDVEIFCQAGDRGEFLTGSSGIDRLRSEVVNG